VVMDFFLVYFAVIFENDESLRQLGVGTKVIERVERLVFCSRRQELTMEGRIVEVEKVYSRRDDIG